jgi:Tol biopolymer transport system component
LYVLARLGSIGEERAMNTVRMILIGVLLVLTSPGSAGAQTGHNLFHQALMQERTYGDLQKAIQIYQRIALEFTEDRALAARALVNLGRACEKLGVPGARDAYQRVVEEFPDQATYAREARAWLEALADARESGGSVAGGQEPTYTLLLDDAPGHHPQWARRFDLSPDGRQVVFPCSDYGAPGVCLIEEVGDHPRLIRELPEGFIGWRGGMPRWSPDGTMIAVQDLNSPDAPGALIIDPEGNLITRVSFDYAPADLAWNPDQQGLTYSPRESDIGGIRSVTLDGRETILAESPQGRRIIEFAGYSPDGRWLAFDTRWLARGSFSVMPSGGGSIQEILMPDGLAVDKPVWGPDGFIYFASGGLTSQDQNLWRVKIDLETGESLGDPEQVTFYTDAGVTGVATARDAGNLVYLLFKKRSTIWVAPSDEIDAARALARGTEAMLSPDGSRVFFVGEGTGNHSVFSVPTSGGTPSRVTPESHYVQGGMRLFPDGSRVVYRADVGTPPSAEWYFHISTAGGEPVQLPVPGGFRDPPEPSPDGSTLVFTPPSNATWIVPVAGGERTVLAEVPGEAQRWSPDGRYVSICAAKSLEDGFTFHVVVIPVDGGEPLWLVEDDPEYGCSWVNWHPDGQRVSYSRTDGADWVAYLDGRPTTLLYNEPGLSSEGGEWAPDGETYISAGYDSIGRATYRRNADGTSELLWRNGSYPSITADGKTWVWSTSVRSHELWMLEGLK